MVKDVPINSFTPLFKGWSSTESFAFHLKFSEEKLGASGVKMGKGCSGEWSDRMVWFGRAGLPKGLTAGHRREGGRLSQKLSHSRNPKPQHLPRPPSVWQGPTESPGIAIWATEPDLQAKAAHDAKYLGSLTSPWVHSRFLSTPCEYFLDLKEFRRQEVLG